MRALKTIEFFEYKPDKSHVVKWLDKLDHKTQDVILKRIEELRLGKRGGCKFLGDDLFELKIEYGKGYRIYYIEKSDTVILLLCAGTKNNAGEQTRDIDKARKLIKDYLTKE